MYRQLLAIILSAIIVLSPTSWGTLKAIPLAPAQGATSQDQQAMDKLLAPIALYPDALLAQVLACAGSPEQLQDLSNWMKENAQLQGSDLQTAAESAGFDASFIALVLFPDVIASMEQNLEWTTEVGQAFSSDQTGVLDSVQRLRTQAQAVGNLQSSEQQEVKTETQNGQTVIVVQPANPQVVYVPQYDPQTVYTAPPEPQKDSSGKIVAAALIAFGLGVALGASTNDHYGYYGYHGWGMHWHTHVVVVRGGVWRRPPVGRYPYVRPRPGYRPPYVNAPRYNRVNVNVNRNINVNRNAYAGTRTPRPVTTSARSTPTTRARPATPAAGSTNRGRVGTAARPTASPARQLQRGSKTGAFSGYQKGSQTKNASDRGRRSAAPSRRPRN